MTWDEWEADPWAKSVRSCCTGCGGARIVWFPACVLADLLLDLDREGNLEAVRAVVLNFEPGDSSWLCGECLQWGIFGSGSLLPDVDADVQVMAHAGATTGPPRRVQRGSARRVRRRRHR